MARNLLNVLKGIFILIILKAAFNAAFVKIRT